MEGNTTYLCATQCNTPTLATLNVTRNRNFQMQSKSMSKRCFTHHLVTKAKYVIFSEQFDTKLIFELLKQFYHNGQSEMLFREREGFVIYFFYNKISGGKGGTKQLLPSHKTKTKQLQKMNVNNNNKKLVLPSSLVFMRRQDKIF